MRGIPEIISYESVVTPPFSEHALLRNDFPGFQEDYLVLHALIRRYRPSRFLEIGTSTGRGTNVICHATGLRKRRNIWGAVWPPLHSKVYSIDVPVGTDPSIIYPEGEDGHPKKPGTECAYRYVQLYGDSTEFDFRPYYPLDGWFVDGKHNFEYVRRDTLQALKSEPRIIVWHDMQIEEVKEAVLAVIKEKGQAYHLYQVEKTRMAFAARRDCQRKDRLGL